MEILEIVVKYVQEQVQVTRKTPEGPHIFLVYLLLTLSIYLFARWI